jgi:hypothetical protein
LHVTSLRIACDLDGTLADMDAALQREGERLFGERVDVRTAVRFIPRRAAGAIDGPRRDSDPAGRPRYLDHRAQKRLWTHVREIDRFWERLPETEPGAVARLAATASMHGWEVLFLTQRPDTAGGSAQVQSQRWLRAHGFELPSVYVVSESRGRIAAALGLDAVIDDRPENCLDVSSDSSARAVLVWRQGRERLPPGVSRLPIQVVSSMAEAIEHLDRLQQKAARPRGLLDLLREALHRA